MSTRRSELKTAPDVRTRQKTRVFNKGKASHPLIPVLERRRMFEEVDSDKQYSGSNTRRGSRLTARGRDLSRSSSLRSSKRSKSEDSSPVLRNKQLSSGALNIPPLWQRLRNFGHYDTQSMGIHSLVSSQDGLSMSKKPTGASAAASNDCTAEDVSNTLIAACPTFKNEIGGDNDWLTEESPNLKLREQLSIEKQKRVGSRQRLIVDGEIPLKELVASRGPMNQQVSDVLQKQRDVKYPFEFVDYGASYYRHYFLGQDHQNFFGIDEAIGPIAVSLKREKVPEELVDYYGIPPSNNHTIALPKHQWRVIFRTSQLTTLRGTILEESIPTSAKIGTSKGIPPRDVVDYITQGEVTASSLRVGKNEKKIFNELVRLDEQELNNKYKIGVMLCKPGQTTEEEMYNNETGSPAFEEFLNLLGDRVKMKGFNKYRAQLDNKTDTTGEYSVYKEFRDTEIMFHVSTLLPYTASNKQQLLRKRHIGNDIVTLVFQEPGCEQFSPKCIRSHFQHIFIIVRVLYTEGGDTKYKVAVSRSQDIPFFGPVIPDTVTEFDNNDNFREFILTKLINACNASLRSEKFSKMAVRTRKQYLTDLAESATTQTLDQVSSGKVAGLLRSWSHRKLREKGRQETTLLFTPGALTWPVKLLLREGKPLPFSEDPDYSLECVMGMAPDFLIFMTSATNDMLLHLPMMSIAGWIQEQGRINLFYDESFCLSIECGENDEDCSEICSRLHHIAPCLSLSHEATLMEFRRGANGLLGFGINEVGEVQKVDGLAKSVGLQKEARLLQVEDRLVCCHSHKQIMEVLTDRSRPTVRAYVIPPKLPGRPVQYYPALNWSEIWSARPNNPDNETEGRGRSGSVTPDPGETLRAHTRSISNTNRMSYMEAVGSSDYDDLQKYTIQVDDSEPVYDRLNNREHGSKSPPRARSPSYGSRRYDSIGYSRINRKMKQARESVVPFEFKSPDPEPVESKVEEYSPGVKAKISNSTRIPDHKPHTAAPLSDKYNTRKVPGKTKPMIEVSSPGQVNELTKKFSFPQSSPGNKNSKIPITPLKATTSASEMTKTPGILPAKQTKVNGFDNEVKLRNGLSAKKNRPSSWDFTNVREHKTDDLFITKDDSTPSSQARIDESFHRNSNIRTAFRRRTASRELSPEPEDSNPEASPAPDNDAAGRVADSPKLSQGSSGSQGPPMSVRERTMKWESRGGGVPSYFTLPRSLRNKNKNSGIPTKTTPTGNPPPSRSPRTSVSSNSTVDTKTSTKRVSSSREEADGSSNPDESYEARSKTVPRKFKSKKVTVTVKSSRRDSRENLLSPKTAAIMSIKATTSETNGTDKSEGSPQPEAPSNDTPTVTDLETLNDKNTSNGDLGYKPRVEEWVRQTSQTALPLESVETPPRDIASPTPTENSLFSQSDSISQADKEMIESLRARVEFLEGKLEQETESKMELGEKLRALENQLTNLTNKKRVKTIKTAMI